MSHTSLHNMLLAATRRAARLALRGPARPLCTAADRTQERVNDTQSLQEKINGLLRTGKVSARAVPAACPALYSSIDSSWCDDPAI